MQLNLKLTHDYKTLETERLLLRPVDMLDAEDMFEYTSDERITQFMNIHNETLADVKTGIETYFLNNPTGKYGLELKKERKLIGTIDFRLDEEISSAELGYVLNGNYHRQEYMYEAVQKMLWLAFVGLEINSVYAACLTNNVASAKLMEKVEMQKEGIQRQRYKMKNELRDVIVYSILREEYM